MTSNRRETNTNAEPLYSRAVFERLRETLVVQFLGDGAVDEDDSYISPNYELRDDGAWLVTNDIQDSLNWTPACDQAEFHNGPDPLTTPALPFPFTARQLAAFMLDGWGWFLHQRFVGDDGLLDVEMVEALLGRVRDAKPREAIKAAFDALAQARCVVGEPDADLAKAENFVARSLAELNISAGKLHDWRAENISEQERDARVQRRNELTESARTSLRQAQAARQKDHNEWRSKVVLWLLSDGYRRSSRDAWTAPLNLEQVSAFLAGVAPDASSNEARRRLVDWCDANLNARYWFGLTDVTAVEAAQLLACDNLRAQNSAGWLESKNEHSTLAEKHELLRGLEGEGGERPLAEWLLRVKSQGWPYHPWIDRYIDARGDSPPCPTTGVPSTQTTQVQRQRRRYQMCVDAGLVMPTNDYAKLPRGIGAMARKEGISRQAFAEDVKAYIRRLNSK